MDELYKLLDDCHTALSKTTLDDEQYNKLSNRLADQKRILLNKQIEAPATDIFSKELMKTFALSCLTQREVDKHTSDRLLVDAVFYSLFPTPSIGVNNLKYCSCTSDRQTPTINGKPLCTICNKPLY